MMKADGTPKSAKRQATGSSISVHPYPSVWDTANYICEEIKRNVRSQDVKELISLLNHYNKSQNSQKQAFKKLTPFGQAAVSALNPSSLLASVASDKVEGRIQAYKKWKGLVANEKIWDHKRKIKEIQGCDWACDSATQLKFMYDIWSNIHYGFIGRYVGFTEFELVNGAGFAQLGDNNRSYGTCAKQYISDRFVNVGDADILGGFDDAEDTQAIKVGFSLFNKFGAVPSVLTSRHIMDELYLFYRNNKPLHIEKCEYHQ